MGNIWISSEKAQNLMTKQVHSKCTKRMRKVNEQLQNNDC